MSGSSKLWFKVLECRYGVLNNWFFDEIAQANSRRASLWWRDIVNSGNDFTNNSAWFNNIAKLQLGRGDKTKFWTGVWCGPTAFADLFPALFSAYQHKAITVAELGCWTDGRWSWRGEFVRACRAVHVEQAEELKTILQDNLLSAEGRIDGYGASIIHVFLL